MSGYDIIGDVHGCGTALKELLATLGYRKNTPTGAYEHPQRQAVFVGDLVDRGDDQLEILRIVKDMVDGGSAQIVMGNHEFNAIAFDTKDPEHPGEYLRRRTEKNLHQHAAFRQQVSGTTRADYLDWFMTFPLWLDLGGIRVLHACWHEQSMRVVEDVLGSNRFSSRDQFVRASRKGDPLYEAIEVLLKGPEIDLARYDLPPYYDKDRHPRNKARLAWWRKDATTLRDLAVMDGNFQTESGTTYPILPDVEVAAAERSFSYRDDVPVFYGHYWRKGQPQPDLDFTTRTACVDFSAVKGGRLVAYRWDGETEVQPEHYVNAAD